MPSASSTGQSFAQPHLDPGRINDAIRRLVQRDAWGPIERAQLKTLYQDWHNARHTNPTAFLT